MELEGIPISYIKEVETPETLKRQEKETASTYMSRLYAATDECNLCYLRESNKPVTGTIFYKLTGLDQNTNSSHQANIKGIKTRSGQAYIYAIANVHTGLYPVSTSNGSIEEGKIPIALDEEKAQNGEYAFTKDMLLNLPFVRDEEGSIQISSCFLDTNNDFWRKGSGNNRYVDATCFVSENYYADKVWKQYVNDAPIRSFYVANEVAERTQKTPGKVYPTTSRSSRLA